MAIAEDLNLLDRKLSELKVQYEHYFSGLLKLEPLPLRAEVQELVRRWNGQSITNTMHKFRYQSLVGKFNGMMGYWNRSVREMEEGTYKRDLFRVTLHEQERREREEKRKKLLEKVSSRGRATDPAPSTPSHTAGPPAAESTEALYRELLDARASCGGNGTGLTRDAFEKLLQSQRDEVRRRFDCSEVDFKVKVESGKVKLVARPRKGDERR